MAVRVSVLSESAVSFGVGVPADASYLVRARAAGLPVVRRSSGGTGVLHASGDITWSLVIPRTHPTVGRDFVRAYDRLGTGPVRFLDRQGVRAEWVPPPHLAPEYCVLSDRGQVLSVGPRILGGAAQHLSPTALMHHGMIPLSVDRELVARLFGLSDALLTERLTGLRELGITAPPEELAPQLATEIWRELRASEE